MILSILLAILAGVLFQNEWYALTVVAALLCLVAAIDRVRQLVAEILQALRPENELQRGLDYSSALDDEQ